MSVMRGIKDAIAVHVPALQAGDTIAGASSRGFTPGYRIAGFQPCADGVLARFHAHFYCVRTN